ncbi:MAG TPA: type IV toxin-antitoxin system AbiEi family antitoxin [Propionibacteriaceae bacterium]|nr:type IV toxin-antitoxin system AbiEi family antitoxin [Propionibacteriaceae bacterium]
MAVLNEARGEVLARHVQQALVRAGMKDVTTVSVRPAAGRRLILRHGPSLYRVDIHPVQGHPRAPDDEPGWLPLLVGSGFDDATVRQLTDAGVSFLDDRGNAHLVLDGRTVVFTHADDTGPTGARDTLPRPPSPHRAAGAVALNRASHRVAFALLADPALAGSPVRDLAAVARTSVGTVHNTLLQLTDAGLLQDGRLHSPGRLLDTWADAYRRLPVRPLTSRALFAADEHWPDTVRRESARDVLLGGISAAAVLDDQVRTTEGIIYAATLGPAVTLLRLTPAPTPFRVEVRERFWGDGLPSSLPGLVPSVLIYGDLLRDGDARSLEFAAHLRRSDAHLRALD